MLIILLAWVGYTSWRTERVIERARSLEGRWREPGRDYGFRLEIRGKELYFFEDPEVEDHPLYERPASIRGIDSGWIETVQISDPTYYKVENGVLNVRTSDSFNIYYRYSEERNPEGSPARAIDTRRNN